MKTNFDHSKLVDAVLADESWQSCSAQLHHGALAAVRAAKKSRARRTAAAQVLALFALLATVIYRFTDLGHVWASRNSPTLAKSSRQSSNVSPAKSAAPGMAASGAPYITEDQMLAMFPQGSCVLAEINGQKQLVFVQSESAGYASSN